MGHVRPRAETGLDNHRSGCVLTAQPGADSAAQGAAENDDPIRGNPPLTDQIIPGCLRIEVSALFAGLAGALTITPVIDDQGVQAQLVEDRDAVQAVGNIAGIAVKKQHHAPRPGRRNIPAV